MTESFMISTYGKSVFVNFSNHPSGAWSEEQKLAAHEYGDIVDLSFPNVQATDNESDILALSKEKVDEILSLNPAAVMCQGEFTLAFAVTNRLIDLNIPVLSACSERMVTETEDGKKVVTFKFEKFRSYNELR